MPSILVVEDRDMAREMLRMALECAGHEVVLVDTDADALDALRDGAVDILLADRLPDAGDLIGAAKRDHPALSVVLMADPAESDTKRARTGGLDGIDSVLTKPVSLPDLYATIGRCQVA